MASPENKKTGKKENGIDWQWLLGGAGIIALLGICLAVTSTLNSGTSVRSDTNNRASVMAELTPGANNSPSGTGEEPYVIDAGIIPPPGNIFNFMNALYKCGLYYPVDPPEVVWGGSASEIYTKMGEQNLNGRHLVIQHRGSHDWITVAEDFSASVYRAMHYRDEACVEVASDTGEPLH